MAPTADTKPAAKQAPLWPLCLLPDRAQRALTPLCGSARALALALSLSFAVALLVLLCVGAVAWSHKDVSRQPAFSEREAALVQRLLEADEATLMTAAGEMHTDFHLTPAASAQDAKRRRSHLPKLASAQVLPDIDGGVPPPPLTTSSSSSSSSTSGTPSSSNSGGGGAKWSYNSPRTGPFNWGNLDPSYAICSSGHRQSPIDFKVVDPLRHPAQAALPSAVRVDASLRHILFNYLATNVTMVHKNSGDPDPPVDGVVNTGQSIQVSYEPGSGITVDDRRFELKQFHFHSPSEHTLNGRHFDMELHLVHEHAETGDRAVVGLWLEVPKPVVQAVHDLRGQYSALDDLTDFNTQGEVRRLLHSGANPFLDALDWDHLPAAEGEVKVLSDRSLNVFDALPFEQGYITYAGSLTTPPCTENVRWFLLKSPVSCSIAQRNEFQSIFGTNARPTQLLHGRNVTMTLDSETPANNDPGVSHNVFLLVLGALLVCAMLLTFAILFLCTRTQHRLARAADDSRSRLYALLSPSVQGGAVGAVKPHASSADPFSYQSIGNPLDEELEDGGRYRAPIAVHAQAAQAGNAATAEPLRANQPQGNGRDISASAAHAGPVY